MASTSGKALSKESPAKLVRAMSLMDSTLLVVGGVIGSAIFLTPKDVAANSNSPIEMMALWAFGAIVAIAGGLSMAELAAMFPEAGGQYVYLREAYGDLPAFLFGWMMLLAGNGGGLATISTGFALYFGEVFPIFRAHLPVLKISHWTLTRGHLTAIVAIAIACLVGVIDVKRMARWINATAWLKFAAMAVFVVLGFTIGHGSWANFHAEATNTLSTWKSSGASWGVALIAVFWAYDGWVYVFWMGGEIDRPAKVIPRSLILGIVAIGAIYLLMNAAFLYAMPIRLMEYSATTAQDAAVALFSNRGAWWLSLMIAVSCFGALLPNAGGGGRLVYAMAKDGLFFRKLAKVHPRWRTPALAVISQSAAGAVLVLTGGYDELFTYTVFAMTLFYCLTVLAVFVLRYRRPEAERPYHCFGYPLVPGLYVAVTALWSINAVATEPRMTVLGLILVGLGFPLYLFWKRKLQPADVASPS